MLSLTGLMIFRDTRKTLLAQPKALMLSNCIAEVQLCSDSAVMNIGQEQYLIIFPDSSSYKDVPIEAEIPNLRQACRVGNKMTGDKTCQ